MQIHREGLSPEQVIAQVDLLRKGVPPIELDRPCCIGDGIEGVSMEAQGPLLALHDEAAAAGRLLKFVPASGAASRMFKDWYRYLDGAEIDGKDGQSLATDLGKYAFIDDLRMILAQAGLDFRMLLSERRFQEILAFILDERGLNYGRLPKALIKFHPYVEGSRTALEEHLVEAALYVRDGQKRSRIHLTVSEEHREMIQNRLAQIQQTYERGWDVTYDTGISIQGAATNTIAVDLENRPFRLDDGRLCFRPGGHGALLENLNAIDGDIVFIKNIDNIVPDRLKETTVRYKKMLCGLLLDRQRQIFSALRDLEHSKPDKALIRQIQVFFRDRLHIILPVRFDEMDLREQHDLLCKKLNRPLRVCGMVRNEGEPGGGPFWVHEADGGQSLQIIEENQVDARLPAQRTAWQHATHFNPVDLVCGVRDLRGKKFDLRRFVNPQTAAITQKSEKGRDLKALEHPGLWNGAMADWNTIFVEVPIETFNPVKTVEDLLRPAHQ